MTSDERDCLSLSHTIWHSLSVGVVGLILVNRRDFPDERSQVIFHFTASRDTSVTAQESPVVALDRVLTPIIRTHFPEAQIQVTDTSYVAKFGTMDFTVHGRQKTGEILAKTHIEEGPNFEGFILRIELQEGRRYQGALRIPQDTPQPYWSTFLDSRTVSKERHFFIRFSYGSRLKKEFKKAVLDALPESLPNT